MDNLKASLVLAVGFWLLYCGVAQGGKYALSPWEAWSA